MTHLPVEKSEMMTSAIELFRAFKQQRLGPMVKAVLQEELPPEKRTIFYQLLSTQPHEWPCVFEDPSFEESLLFKEGVPLCLLRENAFDALKLLRQRGILSLLPHDNLLDIWLSGKPIIHFNGNHSTFYPAITLAAHREQELKIFDILWDDRVLSNPVSQWDCAHLSVLTGKNHLLERLIEKGFPVSRPGRGISHPIHEAMCRGNLEAAQLLLDAGSSLTMTQDVGLICGSDFSCGSARPQETPLFSSLRAIEQAFSSVLCDQAEKRRLTRFFFNRILPWAQARGARLDTMLSHGLDVWCLSEFLLFPPMVKKLIEHGAPVDTSGALFLKAIEKSAPLATLKILIAKGCNVNVITDGGDNAFHLMARSENSYSSSWTLFDFLHRHHCDVNARNDKGQTPLMVASENSLSLDMLRFLLKMGASLDEKDVNGHGVVRLSLTSFHDSPENIAQAKVKMLLAAGAPLKDTCSKGYMF